MGCKLKELYFESSHQLSKLLKCQTRLKVKCQNTVSQSTDDRENNNNYNISNHHKLTTNEKDRQ